MRKITALIIEDEKPARELIKGYLSDVERMELKGEFDNGFSGLKAIQEIHPDVIFLDVQMPKLTGFEMLELLDYRPAVIFTTAYDQFAIRAFEENATDYLLKPFSKERFGEALQKLFDRLDAADRGGDQIDRIRKHLDEGGEILHRVVIKKGGRIHVVATEKIEYLEAQDDYVMIYTKDDRFLKQQTMKFFERHLDPAMFIRVHRSYIVNIQTIDRIEPYEKTNFILSLKSGKKVPVSRTGMQSLKDQLNF
jgi:two-component system, LytTR family, response regulator